MDVNADPDPSLGYDSLLFNFPCRLLLSSELCVCVGTHTLMIVSLLTSHFPHLFTLAFCSALPSFTIHHPNLATARSTTTHLQYVYNIPKQGYYSMSIAADIF